MPLSPGTWVFQFTGGPNQGTTESDSLQANTQLGADSQWQWTAGQTTIYDLSTASDGSIVSPSEQD